MTPGSVLEDLRFAQDAAVGDLTEPSSTHRSTGWTGAEKPSYKEFNYAQQRTWQWMARLRAVGLFIEAHQFQVEIVATGPVAYVRDITVGGFSVQDTTVGGDTTTTIAARWAANLKADANWSNEYDIVTALNFIFFLCRTPGKTPVVVLTDANGTLTTSVAAPYKVRLSDDDLTYKADLDLVFGSSSTEDTGSAADDDRMLFDKSKGAFRAGRAQGTQWNDVNRGDASTAWGENCTASDDFTTAGGVNCTASAPYATALGSGNQATAAGATALGVSCTAAAASASAFGESNQALGTASFCGGIGNICNGNNSVALGSLNGADGLGDIAIGTFNLCTGAAAYKIGIGTLNTVTATRAAAIGYDNDCAAADSTALGGTNTLDAASTSSTAVGQGNDITATQAQALGVANVVAAAQGSAVGTDNNLSAAAVDASAVGRSNTLTGDTSAALGDRNTLSGLRSKVVGTQCVAAGPSSYCGGYQCETAAAATYGRADGYKSKATNPGEKVYAGTQFGGADLGETQCGTVHVKAETTDAATATDLTAGGAVAWVPLDDGAYMVRVTASAKKVGAAAMDAWDFYFTMLKSGGAITFPGGAGTPIQTTVGAANFQLAAGAPINNQVPATGLTLNANQNGAGGFQLIANGNIGETWRWAARIEYIRAGD